MAKIERLRVEYDAAVQATLDYWWTIKTRKPFNLEEQLRPVPYRLSEAKREAEHDLVCALTLRAAPTIGKARRSRAPERREVLTLLDDAAAKSAHYQTLEALGLFSTPSERIEVAMARDLAWALYEIALSKHGVKSFLRIPSKRRAITDGYVHTGKYRTIDGVRVPVVRSLKTLRSTVRDD